MVMDILLLSLAAALSAWAVALAPSVWTLVLSVVSVGLVLAAVIFRRTGPLVASAALLAFTFVAWALAEPTSRLWEALGFGIGLLAMLETGWDRALLVPGRPTVAAYARRLRHLARCGAIASGALFATVTLGQGTAARLGVSIHFAVAVALAALASATAFLLVLWAPRRATRGAPPSR